MIEFLLKLFTAPSLERYRARIPYPIFASIPWLVLFVIFLGAYSYGHITHGPKKGGDENLWVLLLIPLTPAVLTIIGLSIVVIRGRLSGYKPFIFDWDTIGSSELSFLAERMLGAAKELGFQIVWQKPPTDFIGVLGIDLESKEKYHPGDNFPVRATFRTSASSGVARARLKLAVRTLVTRDTGETVRLAEIGNWLVASARGEARHDRQPLGNRAVNPEPITGPAQYMEKFRPIAAQYRLREFRMIAVLVVCLFGVVPVLAKFLPFWAVGIIWLLGGAFVMNWLMPKKPNCPACGQCVGALYGPFCPDCGGQLIERACQKCHKTLRAGRGRNFRIHACTHCGVYLDERGL